MCFETSSQGLQRFVMPMIQSGSCYKIGLQDDTPVQCKPFNFFLVRFQFWAKTSRLLLVSIQGGGRGQISFVRIAFLLHLRCNHRFQPGKGAGGGC